MTYFNVYAWIMFIHMQTCLLRDFIMSGNRAPVSFTQRNRFTKRTTRALLSV